MRLGKRCLPSLIRSQFNISDSIGGAISYRAKLALALSLCLSTTVLGQPTVAPSVAATDAYHGVRVVDPFRNLEDLKNPRTREWLFAQGEYGASLLGRIEGRDALRERSLNWPLAAVMW